MNKTYNAYEVKRQCEKLYSDIICFDTLNLNNKTLQWELLNVEKQKIIDSVSGDYLSLNRYDEIFNIGDLIDVYYMDTKTAIIQSIKVQLDLCTWNPEYIVTSKDTRDGTIYNTTYNLCIHLAS